MSALLEDLKAASRGGILSQIYTWIFDVNFKAVRLYRYSHWLSRNMHLRILPRLLNLKSRRKYGIDIDFGAEIGPGFSIKHGNGIVIGRWVRAGRNLTVYQGVTLGGNSKKEAVHNGEIIVQPCIGDNVKLYTGCIVIGPVVIGDNSEIGAGTVVMQDIPANHIVYSENRLRFREKTF